MIQSPFENALMGAKDLDPGRSRSHFEKVDISVPVALNGIGIGSITTVDLPLWLIRISHQIVGETYFADTTGLAQDGQYSVSWKDERTAYTHGQPDSFVSPDSVWGSVRAGHIQLLPAPMYYAGRNTHTFEVRNDVLRVLASEATFFTVRIMLHCVADYGPAGKTK